MQLIKGWNDICLIVTFVLVCTTVRAEPPSSVQLVPRIEGPWVKVAGNPDLDELTSNRQQPVDFGVWRATDGTWQLWSCIRNTKAHGKTRLFYRWESPSLNKKNWRARGIAMRADPNVGETNGGLQAPHVTTIDGVFYMLYGDWQHICLATSNDGKTFKRELQGRGKVTAMFDEAPYANTRDPMVIKIGELYYCYYAATHNETGGVYCRTSPDLREWSKSTLVSRGGHVATKWWHAECPHVVAIGGYYYLFLTKNYEGQPVSNVWRSSDPLDFGIESDKETYVCELPIAAMELIEYDNRWYVAALTPQLDGIRIAPLEWYEGTGKKGHPNS